MEPTKKRVLRAQVYGCPEAGHGFFRQARIGLRESQKGIGVGLVWIELDRYLELRNRRRVVTIVSMRLTECPVRVPVLRIDLDGFAGWREDVIWVPLGIRVKHIVSITLGQTGIRAGEFRVQ